MDIQQFKNMAKRLPCNISVLIKGDHGIGKSRCVYQVAKEFGLDVIERRLSQLTEGDMIGLPRIDGNSTQFLPPDWIYIATQKPVVLFLDEINRATPEVMQAAFQLVLDREINGVKLHPETRIYSAVNTSVNYQVNELDPALLDRFYIVDLKPTLEDWTKWAKTDGQINPAITDFIIQNERHLEHSGQFDANEIYPSRRSWERVSRSLTEEDIEVNFAALETYQTILGFCGAPAAAAFVDFCKNYNKQITAEDILMKWAKTKKYIEDHKLSNEKFNAIIEKLEDHARKNDWTPKQAERVYGFAQLLPQELTLTLLSKLTDASEKNLLCWYQYAKPLILEILQEKMKEEENNSGTEKTEASEETK